MPPDRVEILILVQTKPLDQYASPTVFENHLGVHIKGSKPINENIKKYPKVNTTKHEIQENQITLNRLSIDSFNTKPCFVALNRLSPDLIQKYQKLCRIHKKNLRNKASRPYQCYICKNNYKDFKYLRRHMRTHVRIICKKYPCNQCSKKYEHPSRLIMHKRTHAKPFSCNECSYKCSKIDHLKLHERIHSGEKPYSCSQCSYKCTDPSSLKKHERKHSGETPYSCDQCISKFANISNLRRHKIAHSKDAAFKCKKCSASYKGKPALMLHERIHVNE